MTLDKCKEILSLAAHGHAFTTGYEFYTALNIAVAAINALVQIRSGDPPLDGELLPGEDRG